MSTSFIQPKRASLFDSTNVPQQNHQNNGNRDIAEHLRITNEEPEEFSATTKTMWISTVNLAKKINALMSPIFEDWHGSLIQVENGMLTCTFYFKPTNAPITKDSTRAFAPIGVTDANNGVKSKIDAINRANIKSNNFELTPYAAELLYDIMDRKVQQQINPFNPKSYNNVTTEVNSNQMFSQVIYTLVMRIDLCKLLSIIYGFKDSNGSRNFFQVNPIRPVDLAAPRNNMYSNWLCSVTLMSKKELDKVLQTSGILPVYGDVPAIVEVESN